jgi:acyl-CoA synthetase (AMP-forming)/AMP-acid ligase II
VLPDAAITFAEVEQRSRVLATQLLAAGVGKGTRVGLHFGYRPEFLVAFLAVARIGALAAPLSTSYAPAELRAALRRADVDTLIVPSELLSRDELAFVAEAIPELPDAVGPGRLQCEGLPYLRQIWVLGSSAVPWAHAVSATDPGVPEALLAEVEADVTAADLLVLIQTSGSTAEPKGVLHTHGAVFRTTASSRSLGGPIFLSMPFFWVGGLITLCTAVQSGTTLLCQDRFEPVQALDLIEQHRATVVASWFTVLHALRTDPSVPDRDLSCIPMLTTAPGTMPYSIPLGMTETLGPHTTYPHPEHGMTPPEHLRGSNGVTGAMVEHRLVDPETGTDIVGDGEGELCVRGPRVTVGMYKRERADVFDADGWYHTGDLVSRREGLWFFVGRTTEMIKTKGANVAPPEVEAVLESLPGVQHAFVIGVPSGTFDEHIAAIVVPRDDAVLDPEKIRSEARAHLSAYKTPSIVIVLPAEDVVWLATGKPDKRAMRQFLPSV